MTTRRGRSSICFEAPRCQDWLRMKRAALSVRAKEECCRNCGLACKSWSQQDQRLQVARFSNHTGKLGRGVQICFCVFKRLGVRSQRDHVLYQPRTKMCRVCIQPGHFARSLGQNSSRCLRVPNSSRSLGQNSHSLLGS